MIKTYIYIIRIIFLFFITGMVIAQEPSPVEIPDTVTIPLKIKAGIELSGPVIYFTDKNILNAEGYLSVDLNEKLSLFLGAGYSDYKYSQYNYEFLNKGIFVKAGVDVNLLKPEIAMGRYWAGIGFRYGFSSFNSETPSFSHDNYWGTAQSSLTPRTGTGHYFEVSPGFRAELFRNLSIGWSVNLRKLIYPGIKKDIRPIYFPGYGDAEKSVSAGIHYFITWNIPFRKIRVAVKQEEPEEPLYEEETAPGTGVNTNSQSIGGNRQIPRLR